MGIVGLTLVSVATVCSPSGFMGVTLPILILLGFGGLAVCGVSLLDRPRWPGIIGLVLGSLCVLGWAALFGVGFWTSHSRAAAFGMTSSQHTTMLISAITLTYEAESQRTSSGAAPVTVNLSAVQYGEEIDPWGNPYRYVLTNTPRGFTFMSDGPDGVPQTADDIDTHTIQDRWAFELPPISGAPAPSSMPSAPTSSPAVP